jgi:hypothetical protein
MKISSSIPGVSLVALLLSFPACSDGGDGKGSSPSPTSTNTSPATATATPTPTPTSTPTVPAVPDTVPDFASASFSNPTQIDNPFFPLVPGTTRAYLGETEDGAEIDIVETLDETREVAGVTARVVRDRVFADGLVAEDTRDFHAQDDGGNVWYMGEEVDNYEYDDEDELIEITHEGAWEAGEDVAETGMIARPGYQMEASPMPGDLYHQEYYPGVAEDMAEVLALDVPVTLDDGSAYTCLQTRDFTPLEPDVNEHKLYAPGIGVIREEHVESEERNELVGIFQTGPDSIPDFAAATFSDPTEIDNPYFPLVPGTTFTYEGETEDGLETTVVEVLEETREVAGVTSRVVRDRVYLEDLLIEDTHDWYAQDDEGNVWYMGEEVDNYEYDDEDEQSEVTHEGAWEAGKDVAGLGIDAVAGIVMKASPSARESYRQEYYPGGAEDLAFVVRLDATLEIDGETVCEDCLQTLEWNPLDPGVLEYKFYSSGVGVVAETVLGTDEVAKLESVD